VPGYSKDGGKNVKMKDEGKERDACQHGLPIASADARVVEWHNRHARMQNVVRWRSTVCRRSVREQLTTNRWLMSEAGSGTSG